MVVLYLFSNTTVTIGKKTKTS